MSQRSVATAQPRVSAASDAYELVGILRGERLAILLDRFATNEPITDAAIAVTIGEGEAVSAEAAEDGTYTVTSPRLGEAGAIEATLSIMVGGDTDVVESVRPVLESVGKTVVHVGPSGSGQTVKAANQLIVAGTIELVAEALVFLEAYGVDTAVHDSTSSGCRAATCQPTTPPQSWPTRWTRPPRAAMNPRASDTSDAIR